MSSQTLYSHYPQNPYQGNPQWSNQPQQGYPPAGSSSPYPSMPNQPGDGLAVAGLVLGIVSMFTLLFGLIVPLFSIFLLPFSIVGIILSALGRRSVRRRTMATVGLVLSIIPLVLILVFGVIDVVVLR